MKQMSLKSILKRKFIATTQLKHDNPVAENTLNRGFTSTVLEEKWEAKYPVVIES